MERVVFQTMDHAILVGDFLSAPGSTRCALLLHMMPADRKSWKKLQEALRERGMASLAIDMRGHGESTVQNGRRISYVDFDDEAHQAKAEDVRASLFWLGNRGFDVSHVALVGASIGANLALRMATERPMIPAVALLSPGENYRGVTTFDAADRLRPETALWAAASQGDDQESFDATEEIIRRASSQKKTIKPFVSSGHGTSIFGIHPKLVDELADWLAEHLPR